VSSSGPSANPPKYYDPGEVEAYISEATTTITALQARLEELARRAADAEQALGDYHPETASLGRALLLASEVADKTISDADARAEEIVRVADERAQEIVEAARKDADSVLVTARSEANRLINAATTAAADAVQVGEARLLAAVARFVESSNTLRAELAGVEDDATAWRGTINTSPGRSREHAVAFVPPPVATAPPTTAFPKGPSEEEPSRPGPNGRFAVASTASPPNGLSAVYSTESGTTVTPFVPPGRSVNLDHGHDSA
jgi:DivIVA protein